MPIHIDYAKLKDVSVSTPIVSHLLETEPDMADIVEEFIHLCLPQLINDIHDFADGRDWQRMAEVVHDLKGVSGNYGFPLLSNMARLIEINLSQGNTDFAVNMLSDLDQLMIRIVKGVESR